MGLRLYCLAIIAAAAVCLPAHGQDWQRVTRLKPGTLIAVHSAGDPPGLDDRCRVDAISASTLSCIWEGDRHTRLVFPTGQVAAVYRVRRNTRSVSLWFGVAATAILIAGLATGNPAAVLIGLIGAIVALDASVTPSRVPAMERLDLVYLR